MKPIPLDGSDGGGQMLRTALTLAMITGQPFRMTNIRGKRRKPGLMRQHLTCVNAACEISGGSADGAEVGSTELVFRAGSVRPGSYQFAIGTAGSTGLLLQTLLPALWLAGGPSTLHLSGGTHNPLAPPFDFIDRVFLPAVGKTGAVAQARLIETGFAPAGGGSVECVVQPLDRFKPLDLSERGPLGSTRIRVPFRNLPASIAQRVLDSALKTVPCGDARIHQLPDGPGQGLVCMIECGFEFIREMSCTFGEMGVSAEKVGHRAARRMAGFLNTTSAVGPYLADQLLLPMALAGEGRFTTTSPDEHLPTNISVIEKFLAVRFDARVRDDGIWSVTCGPAC